MPPAVGRALPCASDWRLSLRRPGPPPCSAHTPREVTVAFLTRGGLLPIPPKSGPACEMGEGTSCEFRADLRGLGVPSRPWGPPGEAASWRARSHEKKALGQKPGPQTSRGYGHRVGGSFWHSRRAGASSQQGVRGLRSYY